jgi:hypothetical protein
VCVCECVFTKVIKSEDVCFKDGRNSKWILINTILSTRRLTLFHLRAETCLVSWPWTHNPFRGTLICHSSCVFLITKRGPPQSMGPFWLVSSHFLYTGLIANPQQFTDFILQQFMASWNIGLPSEFETVTCKFELQLAVHHARYTCGLGISVFRIISPVLINDLSSLLITA